MKRIVVDLVDRGDGDSDDLVGYGVLIFADGAWRLEPGVYSTYSTANDAAEFPAENDDEHGRVQWRVVQRWPNGDELTIGLDDELACRERQAVLDANTSHPSGHQRRVEVLRIERRALGVWEVVR